MAGARRQFDCLRLTGLHASRWNWWRLLYFGSLFLQRSRWCGALLQCWCVTFLRCTVDTSSYSSPIRTYMDNYHSMCVSHGLVFSRSSGFRFNAFTGCVWAFDPSKPLTRMLPGSSPCELRLMLLDLDISTEGFHDVIIENLAASPTWQSWHISPGDVTSLRRRWPKAVFRTM